MEEKKLVKPLKVEFSPIKGKVGPNKGKVMSEEQKQKNK